MKANELVEMPNDRFTMSVNFYPAKSHYKQTMLLGRAFPTTATQARFFISKGVCLDVLTRQDVELLERFLNKHGFEGKYRYTKSKLFARLQNGYDLHLALKKEFGL
jgi:hypothetical protein